MRRYEKSSSPQQASAFRVLSPGRQQLQYEVQVALHRPTPPPPPPRAPEPYKLTTSGRTQRKSAFAIIAEPPQSSSRSASRPTSPTGFPASGRVSPFRGRGFKGPLPRSRSRPHTPPRGSAQNSPKRSLSQIPRPSNTSVNRVATLSGSKDDVSQRKSSPKFGRRAVNLYTSSVGSNNQQQQRNANLTKSTVNKKPSTTSNITTTNGKLKQKAAGSGQEINNRLLRVPPKTLPSGKRFVTANNNKNNNNNNNNHNNNVNRVTVAPRAKLNNNGTSDNSPESPSKIPLRNGTSSLSASREMLNKPAIANKQTPINQNVTSNDYDDKHGTDITNKMEISSSSTKDQTSSQVQSTNEEQDLGLVDLLKQSSGAMGTQSVVNTTTTTAVQPLQIDAASILAEAELVAKLSNLEKKQKEMEIRDNQPSTKKDETPLKEDKGKNGPLTQTMIKHFGPNANVNDEKRSTSNNVIQIEQHKATNDNLNPSVSDNKQPESSTIVQSKDEQAKSSKQSSIKTSAQSSATSASAADKKVKKTATTTNNVIADTSLTMQTQATGSSESLGSIRSTDTGVSLNTVRGVSSAKEKTGIHMVKRAEEIETLSGNIVHAAAAADSNGERPLGADSANNKGAAASKWANLKSRLVKRLGCVAKRPGVNGSNCWPKMRCLACRRDPKAQLWPGKKLRGASTIQLTAPASGDRTLKTRWDRFKDACRCVELRERRRRRRMQRLQVAPLETSATMTTTPPAIVTARKCCPISIGALCRGLFSKCTCCARRRASLQSEHSSKRSKSVRAKHSLTSVNAGPPLSEKQRPKLPETLVESNSVMRGAIPCLPIPIAWFCLICNVLIPGSGTVLSGLFNICMGQPRFSMTASPTARFGAFVVNTIVGVSQLFTVLFCLVGWGWSIWWGVSMVRVARKYKRFKEVEAAANDPEARAGPETATLPAPGIPPLSSLRPAAAAERPR